METNGLQFVERIDLLLKKKNQTRVDMCKMLNIRNQSVTDWKYRGTIPSADTAMKVADYLNVDLRWLLYGETEKESEPDVLKAAKLFSLLDAADRASVMALLKSMSARYTLPVQQELSAAE